jgi:hypothetical protein
MYHLGLRVVPPNLWVENFEAEERRILEMILRQAEKVQADE